jgi:cytidine deaminase
MMENKNITTAYEAYALETDLPEMDQRLIHEAKRSCDLAHAPYSEFFVGAALVTHSGKIILGANQENASFPIGACAERVAIYQHSMTNPKDPVIAIAITAKRDKNEINQPVSPCGSCRQILVELENKQNLPIRVILAGMTGPVIVFHSSKSLLPFSFDPQVFLKQ